MSLTVQKYGGSSLASPQHIRRAALHIQRTRAAGTDLVVVVSAMGYLTDHLLKIAKRTVARPPERELDMLLTAGERISMSLLAMALDELGVPAISFTGSQSGIVTNNDHTQAKIIDIRGHRIREELSKGKVVIIAGFQGVSEQKEITTLGRGGSDTTAVALSAYLKADRCEILTDVDGLFEADPRLVPSAKLIDHCSYDEALELAALGAKMQPRSLDVAKKFEVPVRIASAKSPQTGGTVVSAMEQTRIVGVATQDEMSCLQSQLTSKELLVVARAEKVPMRFLSHSSHGTTVVVESGKADRICKAMGNALLSRVDHVCLVSAVGEGLGSDPCVFPSFMEALQEVGAEPLWLGANALSLTAAIASSKKAAATRAVHAKLMK